jgi:ubiquinone/menaquinone biosynthesis C-methylase UbiE
VNAEASARSRQEETPQAAYFGLQAAWGITKHMGGRRATSELAELAHVGAQTRLLEVGCGTGASTCFLARSFGCQIVAVDLSPDMVRRARDRVAKAGLEHLVRLDVANAEDLGFEDATFDAVASESVVAFLDKPRALAEFVRVTRPGGWVALNEVTWIQPPPPSLVAYLQRAIGGARFLDAEGWQDALAAAGLADIEVRVRSVGAVQQWASEMQQLDPREYVAAWRTFAMQLGTSPATRRYLRELWPPPASVFRVFRYFGYGLYIGTVPGGAASGG